MLRASLRFGFWFVVVALASSAVAEAVPPSCYVREGKACRRGTITKDSTIALCKVGGENGELRYFKNLTDCESGRHPSVVTGGDSAKIPDPKPCYYLEPYAGKDVCTEGTPGEGDSALCIAGDKTISQFFADSRCKTMVDPKACWTLAPGTEGIEAECDGTHVGKVIIEGKSTSCKVGDRKAEPDFFFDNQCISGSLIWTAKRGGVAPDEMTATQARMKINENYSPGEEDQGTAGPSRGRFPRGKKDSGTGGPNKMGNAR